jgi:hypothetical protein
MLVGLCLLRWPERETVMSSATPFNNPAAAFFLQVRYRPEASLPFTDRGGEGRWRCKGGSSPVRVAGTQLPPLAGLGGEGMRRFRSGRSDQAWKLIQGAVAFQPDRFPSSSLAGRGGEERRGRDCMLLVRFKHLWSPLKLKMRSIPSGGEEHRRYPWPRGPHRTSRVPAPRRNLFLQADMPTWRFTDLDTTIHPGGGPSGVVPGVVVSGWWSGSWCSSGGEEVPDCFSVLASGGLLVKSEDLTVIRCMLRFLFVIMPTA